jgi:hypothetical protein
MNDRVLTRHYDKLTAHERFALILAAAARGDEAERARLLDSAPRSAYRLPHHWGVTESFLLLSKLHFMKLLELAADYLESFATAVATKTKRGTDCVDPWTEVLLCGYLFRTYLDGWQRFCGELNVVPQALWEGLPGFQKVQRAERLSGPDPEKGLLGAAYVEEGAARCLARQALGDPEADVEEIWPKFRPTTADDIAATLRTAWGELLAKWG